MPPNRGRPKGLLWAGIAVPGFLGMILIGWRMSRGPAARREALAPPPRIVGVAEPLPGPVVAGPGPVVAQDRRPAVAAPDGPPAPPAVAPRPLQAVRRSLTIQEIVTRSEASVALIKGPLGSGSGFVVAPGLVATNAHVIASEPIRRLEVHFPSAPAPDRGPFVPRLRYKDTRRDLALLAVETRLDPLALCRADAPRRGEEVTIIGSPGLAGDAVLKNAVSRGIVSMETELGGDRFLQLGASVNSGNSGGPAFDARGEVIGVVTARAAEREAIGFCIPVEDLIAAMSKAEAMSKDQVATAAKWHDVESIARRLRTAGRVHGEIIGGYISSMEAALQTNEPLGSAIRNTRRQVVPRLDAMNARLLASIPEEVRKLVADPDLALPVRRDLESLWEASVGLRRFVEGPPEDPQVFVAVMKEVRDRLTDRLDRLSRTLGVTIDD